MKKLLNSVFIVSLIVMVSVGCGSNNNVETVKVDKFETEISENIVEHKTKENISS